MKRACLQAVLVTVSWLLWLVVLCSLAAVWVAAERGTISTVEQEVAARLPNLQIILIVWQPDSFSSC